MLFTRSSIRIQADGSPQAKFSDLNGVGRYVSVAPARKASNLSLRLPQLGWESQGNANESLDCLPFAFKQIMTCYDA